MTKARNLSLLSAVEAAATADQTKADIEGLAIDVVTSQMPSGSVLQVVSIGIVGSQTLPNTSYADVATSSITITPSATSSKILLMWNTGGMAYGENNSIAFRMYRGSSVVREIVRYGYTGGSAWSPCPIAIQYVDNPSSTSAVTYKLQCKTEADADFRINPTAPNGSMVIIAMEIGG